MATEPPAERLHGLDPQELAPGEVVLHHWSAPDGIGILTNRRCLLLRHPHPIHRSIEWSASLADVESIEVQQLTSVRGIMKTTVSMPQGITGPTIAIPGDMVPAGFAVRVDGVDVFHGTPFQCEEVQRWIGGARARGRPELADRPLGST
jgi:hypothetical protein